MAQYAPPSGAVYVMGFIGAIIYFLQHAVGFGAIVLGVLKALVWPAILVYDVLKIIGA